MMKICDNHITDHIWISVKDRLPPTDGTPFLGYDPTANYNAKIYVLIFDEGHKNGNFEYKDRYLESAGEGYYIWEPTHWMPLPTPPEE
jgi:hypothetical protein